MATRIAQSADPWLLRLGVVALIVVALWLVVGTAVDWASWRRDVTHAVIQLHRQTPAPGPGGGR